MVVDVASGPPQIAAYACAPLPHSVVTILAKAIDNRTTGAVQSIAHLDVSVDHNFVRFFRRTGSLNLFAQPAEIVLEIIDTPGRIGLRILQFMSVAAFEFCTGL